MTHTTQTHITCTSSVHKTRTLGSLAVEAKLAKSDHQAGHEYVPMDVYIDAKTMKEHFRYSSILARKGERAKPRAKGHKR